MNGRSAGRQSRPRRDRGLALLITLLVVALLVVVTMEFGRSIWHQYLVADGLGRGARLGAIARSGVVLGKVLLEQDGAEDSQADSLLARWAIDDDTDLSALFDEGVLELRITDESGRLQVNSLALQGAGGEALRQSLLNLLLSGGFRIEGDSEARTIVDSLVDWIDEDDQEQEMGAETGYYRAAGKEYGCRNAPVRTVEELLLVRGISRKLLFGGEGLKALADFITVYGEDGKININTAPLEVLAALNPLMNADLGRSLDDFRRDSDNGPLLADPGWYLRVPSWPGDVTFDPQLITTSSRYFSIAATGSDGNGKRKLTAVVGRDARGIVGELFRRVE